MSNRMIKQERLGDLVIYATAVSVFLAIILNVAVMLIHIPKPLKYRESLPISCRFELVLTFIISAFVIFLLYMLNLKSWAHYGYINGS